MQPNQKLKKKLQVLFVYYNDYNYHNDEVVEYVTHHRGM